MRGWFVAGFVVLALGLGSVFVSAANIRVSYGSWRVDVSGGKVITVPIGGKLKLCTTGRTGRAILKLSIKATFVGLPKGTTTTYGTNFTQSGKPTLPGSSVVEIISRKVRDYQFTMPSSNIGAGLWRLSFTVQGSSVGIALLTIVNDCPKTTLTGQLGTASNGTTVLWVQSITGDVLGIKLHTPHKIAGVGSGEPGDFLCSHNPVDPDGIVCASSSDPGAKCYLFSFQTDPPMAAGDTAKLYFYLGAVTAFQGTVKFGSPPAGCPPAP